MGLIVVSNSDRVVFPEIGRTKGDVVEYFERIAPRALPHAAERPLSMRRFPKGLAGPGFFQKNVPAHYPGSIGRCPIPRSAATAKKTAKKKSASDSDVTVYPIVHTAEHLAYVANQGALELHVPTARLPDLMQPDRVVVDLDPPPGATALVKHAAAIVREALEEHGLSSVPVATGSKGYHVIAPLTPAVDVDVLAEAIQKLAMLLGKAHPTVLTTTFRVAQRGKRVFVDWLRNNAGATVIAPYSLRARPRATVATPLEWTELESRDPDAFTIADIDVLLDRADPLLELSRRAPTAEAFVRSVSKAFDEADLELERFDRFRS